VGKCVEKNSSKIYCNRREILEVMKELKGKKKTKKL
jgi:hypothetical protein